MMNDSDRLLVRHTEDHPATQVYGDLNRRHMKALQEHGISDEQRRIYGLIEALRVEYPVECKVWEDRYDTR